jgi:hypothetical protein
LSWSICLVKRVVPELLPLFRSQTGALSGCCCHSPRSFFPEVGTTPIRCLSSCVIAVFFPLPGSESALALCFILHQVGRTIGGSGSWGSFGPPSWLFSVSSFDPVKTGRRAPRKQRHEWVWLPFLGLPPSPLLLQVVLKGVPIHLTLPPGGGGALDVALATPGWSLASYASLLAALFSWGPFRSSAGFSPFYPSDATAVGRCFPAFFKPASRLRQVHPGSSPLWPMAPSRVKFCVLAIGMTP